MGFRNLRLGEERGIAMPLVLAVVAVLTVLVLAAAASAITANHQSFRDRNSKRAFQAAVAGVQSANDWTTLLQPDPDKCVVKDSATGVLSREGSIVSGWCVDQPPEDLGDGASYTQRISAASDPPYYDATTGQYFVQREIVSTGKVNGITRRVDVITRAATAAPLFPIGYAAVSLDPINWGNKMRAYGNVGSNGDINLSNEAKICDNAGGGNATPGPNKQVTLANLASVCGSKTAAQDPFLLDPVDQKAQDSNFRIGNALSTAIPKPSPSDTCTNCNGVTWNATTRVLALSGSATLTLGGNIY
jgi:Tfp pilus assembly protein PilX